MSTPTIEVCLEHAAERLGVLAEIESISVALREAERSASLDVSELANLNRRNYRARSIVLAQLRAVFDRLETVH